jgi:uncharacterized protein (DUF433 family)
MTSSDSVIVKAPEIMHGIPVFRGTRVPIQALFDYLEGGETLEEFLEGFPTVSRAMAVDALEQTKDFLCNSAVARPSYRPLPLCAFCSTSAWMSGFENRTAIVLQDALR